jgi:Uncharacterized conserved protein
MILFDRIFVDPILQGNKIETRRLGEKRWNVGSTHQATTNRFKKNATIANLLILEVEHEPVGAITELGARLEGFSSRQAFLDFFYEKNKKRLDSVRIGGWEMTPCWRIRFQVVKK